MRNAVLLLIAGLSLSGCMSMDSLSLGKSEPTETDYYLVDTKFRFICLGNTTQCRDMTKIVSSRSQLAPIEEAYGTKVKGPNYPVSLTRMLLNPADGSYTSSPAGTTGRYFKIPVNDKTQIAWDALGTIESGLY
ncbi:hypothetical protein ACMXYX_15005 [Neptuniibacter sp. QD72_48]|uniref:hypothetical protein n=1 Tax=Neptuniibacter sp. QD72_48 TaxID=3398214 RepID=UPI0039F5C9D7